MENTKKSFEFKKIIVRIFFFWGIISAIFLFITAVQIVGQISQKEKIDTASKSDVQFILNSAGLKENNIQVVIHSYVSPRSFTGDHLDLYAIKTDRMSPESFDKVDETFGARWYRGDRVPNVLMLAISEIDTWVGDDHKWFPTEQEILSEKMYVGISSKTTFYGESPAAYEIIMVRPADDMIYYISSKI